MTRMFPEIKCQFIGTCIYTLGNCNEEAQKICEEFKTMTRNLHLAETLPCSENPRIKCDAPQNRALLPNIEKCTLNGKCALRQIPEISPLDFNTEFSPKVHLLEPKGMKLVIGIRKLFS